MRKPLSAREEETLRFLLSDGRLGADQVLASVPHLRVVGECGCGCATVDFEDSRGAEDWDRQSIFAETVDSRRALTVHVLVDEDRLVPTRLEVYGDGDDSPDFPSPNDLRLIPADTN